MAHFEILSSSMKLYQPRNLKDHQKDYQFYLYGPIPANSPQQNDPNDSSCSFRFHHNDMNIYPSQLFLVELFSFVQPVGILPFIRSI